MGFAGALSKSHHRLRTGRTPSVASGQGGKTEVRRLQIRRSGDDLRLLAECRRRIRCVIDTEGFLKIVDVEEI